jgi:cytochrome P450
MGGAALHLSRHPEDRSRLLAEPELMSTAVEEFLRMFAPVTAIGRMASGDVEVAGQHISRGDPVLLLYRSANRDGRVFEHPDEVVLDRKPNRHLTFSAGIHRCPGSNFARMELRVMLAELLRRIPDYQVVEDGIRSQPDISIINSFARMPVTFPPGTRHRTSS